MVDALEPADPGGHLGADESGFEIVFRDRAMMRLPAILTDLGDAPMFVHDHRAIVDLHRLVLLRFFRKVLKLPAAARQGKRIVHTGIPSTFARQDGFQPAIRRRIATLSLSSTCFKRLIANRFSHARLLASADCGPDFRLLGKSHPDTSGACSRPPGALGRKRQIASRLNATN